MQCGTLALRSLVKFSKSTLEGVVIIFQQPLMLKQRISDVQTIAYKSD
jgi:hypothetical protein